jgi:hypothetical protein
MKKSNQERAELKAKGFVYDPHLRRWLHHAERQKYYEDLRKSEMWSAIILYTSVGAVLLWLFVVTVLDS